MNVYNRKMFRKKGGGATGIMASGPELIKAQSGTFVNMLTNPPTFGGVDDLKNLVQNISLSNIIGAGGQPQNTRPNLSFTARSVNPTTKYTPPSLMQRLNRIPEGITSVKQATPSGSKSPLFGFDLDPMGTSNKRLGAVKDMAKTESEVMKQQQNRLIDFDQFGKKNPKSGESLGLGEGEQINNELQKINEKFKKAAKEADKVSSFDLEGDEAFDDSTAIEQEQEGLVKKVQPKVIGGGDDRTKPSGVNDLDTMLTKVFGETKTKDTTKGSGAENKGGGKASLAGEATKNAYKETNKLISSYVEKGDSEHATNTQLMQAGFKKSDVEKMSPAEKVAEVKNIIKEVMGSEDSGPDDDLNAMNTIMLGLSIAAGDSPDALTNIIKGSKDYTERRMKNLKEKRDREEKLDLLALTTVLNREDKEDDRNFIREKQANSQKHDMRMFVAKSGFEMEKQLASFNFKELINKENNLVKLQLDANQTERFTLGLKSTMAQTIAKIKSNEAIANSSNALKADIANANNENQLLRATLSNLPDGYAFAMQEGLKNNLTGDELFNYAKEKGQMFAKSNIFTGPDSLRRMVINVAPKVMKEQNMNFNEAVNHIVDSVSANQTLLQAFPEITKFKNTIASPTTATLNTADSKILDQRNIKVGDSFISGGQKYKRTADNKIELVGG